MVATYIARSKDEWDNFKTFVWDKMEFPTKIEYRVVSNMRTISQNSLQHMWYSEMSQYFSARNYSLTQVEAKKLMKHLFLGYEDSVIGETEIKGQLRSTAGLDKGEAMEYMDRIDSWCIDKGLYLTKPASSEYMQLKEAQER